MGHAVCKRLQSDKVQNQGDRQAGRWRERQAEMASYESHFNFTTKSFKEHQITVHSLFLITSCY